MAKKKTEDQPFEKTLWLTADKLRKNIDASEYKHVVLGLIFLKYISDSFEELYAKLLEGKGEYEDANPEDKDEYKAESIFFVPEIARWSYLQAHAKQPDIGKKIDDAMVAIEKENPTLKGVLPKEFAKPNLDKQSLGQLIDLVGKIALGDAKSRAKDVLGRVYEYFLGQFALAEGRKGGQFYTPESIVRLLVEMLEPYNGRVFDPCCGSGGMFVQSEKFIENHQGRLDDISIYGQESNQTTWRLAKMNLAIRGIDASNVKWNNEGSFLKDAHPDLKSDYIIANPPFNMSDWSGDLLMEDSRWKYGTPPKGNANFAWVQHFLPTQLFYNTGIPACLWFLSRYKNGNKNRNRKNEVLFIDASDMGYMVDRRNRAFDYEKDITKIASTYHHWKSDTGTYEDIKGFCKSANLTEIVKHKFVLTPGRYVGIPDEVDDGIPFEDKMKSLTGELKEQMEEAQSLDLEIKKQLSKVGFEI
jgi:type I restriction enzyme M protein